MGKSKHGEKHGLRSKLCEHFVLALLVASAVALLHYFHLIAWFDAGVVRWTGAFHGSTQATPPAKDDPLVLLIGQALYETAFEQTSPLKRDTLATLVGAVRAKSPEVLVIDIDVSPNAALPPQGDALQRALVDGGAGRVVLPVPAAVLGEGLLALKLDWMQQVCAAPGGRIDFAWPGIRTAGEDVLDFDASLPTLGIVAREPSRGLCRSHVMPGRAAALIDANLSEAVREAELRSAAPQQRRFTGEFPMHVAQARHVLGSIDLKQDAALNARLQDGRGTVILGGAYSAGDRFSFPVAPGSERTEGALVHAAIYASHHADAHSRIGPHWQHLFAHLRDFLFEIAFGMACAFLFEFTFGRLERARDEWYRIGAFGAWMRVRAWVVANLALGVAIVAGSVWAVARLAAPYLGWWPELGAVVLGVFVKFVITSRDELEHVAGRRRHPSGRRSPIAQCIDWMLGILLVLAALFSFVCASGF